MANEKKSIISILADTSKYEQAIESLKGKTRELHSAISSAGGTVDVDTNTAERKINSVKGEVKELRGAITTRHQLDLRIDDYEQKIRKARGDLKLLDSDTEEAQSLRLDIKQFQRGITEARQEFREFENQGEKSIDTLKGKVGQLGKSFESLKGGIEMAGKAMLAYQALQGAADVVMSTEETAKQLVMSGVSVKDANNYANELKMNAADMGIKGDVYNEAYIGLVKAGIINAENTMSSNIGKTAMMIEGGGDISQITTALGSLKQNFGLDNSQATNLMVGLMNTPGMKDTKNIPDYLAEYAGLAKERGLNVNQLTNFLMTASKQNTFNLDKPLDMLKEQGARYSDIFTRGDQGQLKTLNQIFGQEFGSIRQDYLSGKLSSADVAGILSEKSQGLSKAKQLQLVLDVFGTQSEDLGIQNTVKLFQSIKQTKGNEAEIIMSNADIIANNRQELANRSLTQKLEGGSAVVSTVTGKIMDYVSGNDSASTKVPVNITNINNFGSDVTARTTEQKAADLRAKNAK